MTKWQRLRDNQLLSTGWRRLDTTGSSYTGYRRGDEENIDVRPNGLMNYWRVSIVDGSAVTSEKITLTSTFAL